MRKPPIHNNRAMWGDGGPERGEIRRKLPIVQGTPRVRGRSAMRMYRDVGVPAANVAGRDRVLLALARDHDEPVVCVYDVPGDVLALGRYHALPRPGATDVTLVRRLGGGRVAPLGTGFIGVTLCLPHRAALVADEPAALAPEQVLNRAVRPLLGALEALGVAAYYPGRDTVTVDGRIVASLDFDVADDGATIVEMVVAAGRSFALVSRLLDRADPEGVVWGEFVAPESATSIAERLGRTPTVEEMAGALALGCERRLGSRTRAVEEPPPRGVPDTAWLAAAGLPAHLDRHARVRQMLGVLDVHAAASAGRVEELRLCGDFIAPSGTIARLEAALRGCELERAALVERIRRTVVPPTEFVLGIRPLDAIADAVLSACR